MATEVERLVVSLEASITKYERAMQKALGETNKTARSIERRFTKMSDAVSSSLKRAFALVGGVAVLRQAQELIDTSTRIENSLKIAGLAGDELRAVYDRLYASAQKNVAPIESLVTLYGRASLVQNELGASTEDLLNFTDKVALALRVSGQSAEQSSGAILQLSQALGSGVVRAEEFNSILEGALPIAQAAAAGIDEAGGSVARLRQLVTQGKVSSEAFFKGFEAGSVVLEDKVAGAQLTVSQGAIRLQNVLIDVAGTFNENTELSKELVVGLDDLGRGVQDFAGWLEQETPTIRAFFAELENGRNIVQQLASEMANATGGDRIGFDIANSPFGSFFGLSSSLGRRVLNETFKALETAPVNDALQKALDGGAPLQIKVTPAPGDTPTKVSLADYPVNAKKTGSGTSSGDKFAAALAAQERQNEVLRQRTALQATLNPLINDYGRAVEKLKVQQDLENDATKNGLALTPDRQAAIEKLAEAYADASVEAARLAEQQKLSVDQMDLFNDTAKSALSGFISDLRQGKNEAEVLGNAINRIGDKLLDFSLNLLFGGGPGGFSLLNLFGFANGGIMAHGKPVKLFGSGGVSNGLGIIGDAGPEAAVPLPDGRRIPVELRMPKATVAMPQQFLVHVVTNDEKFSAYVTDHAGNLIAQAAPHIVGQAITGANQSAPGALARYQYERAGGEYRG